MDLKCCAESKHLNISASPFLLSAFVCFIHSFFQDYIAEVYRFSIYSLYSYKNSRRARGCSLHFKDFTIKGISTFSPELLLLCFCGQIQCTSFFFFLILCFPHSIRCFWSMNFAHVPFCLCSGFTQSRTLFGAHALFLLCFRSSDLLKENPVDSWFISHIIVLVF